MRLSDEEKSPAYLTGLTEGSCLHVPRLFQVISPLNRANMFLVSPIQIPGRMRSYAECVSRFHPRRSETFYRVHALLTLC